MRIVFYLIINSSYVDAYAILQWIQFSCNLFGAKSFILTESRVACQSLPTLGRTIATITNKLRTEHQME